MSESSDVAARAVWAERKAADPKVAYSEEAAGALAPDATPGTDREREHAAYRERQAEVEARADELRAALAASDAREAAGAAVAERREHDEAEYRRLMASCRSAAVRALDAATTLAKATREAVEAESKATIVARRLGDKERSHVARDLGDVVVGELAVLYLETLALASRQSESGPSAAWIPPDREEI